jgi:hypothetical protein
MTALFRSLARRPVQVSLFVALLGIAMLGGIGPTVVRGQAQPDQEVSPMLRHVVLFQFKPTSSRADVQRLVDAFRKLPSQIDVIADFEYGVNNSPEGLDGGLTHCFLLTFKSEADRAVYLPHPAHLAFVEILKPHLEKATVVDYWAGK